MQSMPKESGVIFYLFCQAGGSGGKSSEEMVLELSADQESGILSFSAFVWLARNIPSLNFPWIIDHLSLFES